MKAITTYGPALVVLAAVGAVLVAAPTVIRNSNEAETLTNVRAAAQRLEQTDVLALINQAQRDIATLVEPSVVHVSTETTAQRRRFSESYASSGSGWIWDEDGHIVTNAHVVDGADRIQIQLHDGEVRSATLVGLDLHTDIAVLVVSTGRLHPSRRGDSDAIRQGDQVFAFGSPFDFRFSMSRGIVSGLGRSAGLADIDYENFIQTDAAINPGNSGGPLTDIRGQVIGMNTAIATGRGNSVGQGQFAGIGLAIPIAMIDSVVSQIIEMGEVKKGYLGVSVASITLLRSGGRIDNASLRAIAKDFKGEGAAVSFVSEGSPAAKAGLLVGDVIVALDGKKITEDGQIPAIISSKRPGTTVQFSIVRPNAATNALDELQLTATLAELDPALRASPALLAALRRAGFESLVTSNAASAARLEATHHPGVLIEDLREGSDVDRVLDEGDAIIGVMGQPIQTIDELYARVQRSANPRGVLPPEIPLTCQLADGRTIQIMVRLY
ncbi:MAG: PDZ domain-containing protein [Phycisphaerales bacterium]|nr:PDZ domain-containing protein [Phycisphaerales bacterium]